MFRWWAGERFYLEAGIGATLFSTTRFANENISTAFHSAITSAWVSC